MIRINFTLFKKSWLSLLTLVFCMGFQLSYAQTQPCPIPGESVGCKANINVGLSEFCSLTITPDDLIADDISMCAAGTFIVDIAGTEMDTIQVGVGDSFDFQVGQTVRVEVRFAADSSIACWGNVLLEDKSPPTIECPRDTIVECTDDTSIAALGMPTVDETCGGFTVTDSDVVVEGDCEDGFLRLITRTFIVTNASGMTASCEQVITVNRQTIENGVDPPATAVLSCNEFGTGDDLIIPTTAEAGSPTIPINGEDVEISDGCGLFVDFTDEIYPECEGTTKIIRTFIILDHCTTPSVVRVEQLIKILDDEAPEITGLEDITVSTDFDVCSATFDLPTPTLTDNCANAASLTFSAAITSSEGGIIVAKACCPGEFEVRNLPILPAGDQHTITYTATDPCGNQSTADLSITVEDQVAPTMSCESFRKVTLQNSNLNEPSIVFARAFDDGSFDACGIVRFDVRRMDSCIDFDWTTNGAGIDSNEDGFVPDARDEGTGFIINDEEVDFGPAVPFSCCDIGNTVMVVLRATDAAGNTNFCMVEVEVEDKAPPVVDCPVDVLIECLDELPSVNEFLSEDQTDEFNTPTFAGTPEAPGDSLGFSNFVTDNCGATLYINQTGALDECGVGTITRTFVAVDAFGNRSEICDQDIDVENNDPFTITDEVCNSDATRSTTDGAEWPCDITLTCGIGGDLLPATLDGVDGVPDEDVRPQIQRNDRCDRITLNFEDEELTTVGNEECRKILRTWIITDWCQFELDRPSGVITAGVWRYTQLIKIEDNEAPVIDCPGTVSVDANSNCTAVVDLTVDATGNSCEGETLLYTFVLRNEDGSINAQGSGNDLEFTLPVGSYSITFSVEDFCGNVGENCTQLIFVEDNTGPSFSVITQTDVNLSGGQGELWPDEVELSIDDDCSDINATLIVRTGGDGQTEPPAGSMDGDGLFFDCDDLTAGASDGTVLIDFWAQDGSGNWSYVTILVNVDDSQGNCAPVAPTASVAGTIMTEELETVGGVTINIDGNASAMPTAMVTANDGAFNYDLATMMNYTVEPYRNDYVMSPNSGLTVYDLIIMGQHLLEDDDSFFLLDSPYKLIAADVNNSGTITLLDMIALRRVLLFIDSEFPNNTSWRFVEADYIFPNATAPFAQTVPTFTEATNINNLTIDQLNTDFVAVRIGDLNQSGSTSALAAAGDTRSRDGDLVFNVADQKLVAGNTYSVDVKANDFTNMLGYQFTLAFDQNAVEFEDFTAGALRGLTDDNFGFAKLNEGALTTVWSNTNGVSVNNDEVLFTLNFVAKKDGNLSDVISVDELRFTPAEAYTNNGELFDVAFNFDGKASEAGFSLGQNRPNPFRNETVIEFELPEATTATLTIYDVSGRVLKVIERDYTKGANMETINSSDLNATGVLYYQLDTPTQSATMKMIMMK